MFSGRLFPRITMNEIRKYFDLHRPLFVSIFIVMFLGVALSYYSFAIERSIVVEAITDELEIEFDGNFPEWLLGEVVLCRRKSSFPVRGSYKKKNYSSCDSNAFKTVTYRQASVFWKNGTLAVIRRSRINGGEGYGLFANIKKVPAGSRGSFIQHGDPSQMDEEILRQGDTIYIAPDQANQLGRLPLSGKITLGTTGSGFGVREILKRGSFRIYDSLLFRSPLMVKSGKLSVADTVRFFDSDKKEVKTIGAIAPFANQPDGLSVISVSQADTHSLAIMRLGLEEKQQIVTSTLSDRVIVDPVPAFISVIVGFIASFLTLYRASHTILGGANKT